MSDEPAEGGIERYIVQQGDCMSSIAAARGFLWKTLWAQNPGLQSLRKNPNTLQPGDVVLVPSLTLGEETRATDQRHRFQLKSGGAKFRLVLERNGQALANKQYILSADGEIHNGSTNDSGLLEVILDPRARSAQLRLPEDNLEYQLNFGHMDPLEEVSGVHARLQNLGYYDGELDVEWNDASREALSLFQAEHGIEITGEMNDQTRQKLDGRHDRAHSNPNSESNDPPRESAREDVQTAEPRIDRAADERLFASWEQLED